MQSAEMTTKNTDVSANPLAAEPIGSLIRKFAVPAILSSLVNSIYNIVDQVFIGQSVGMLGNAATNVAFPLVMIMAAIAMTCGVGGASQFSLLLGRGQKKEASRILGNSLVMMVVSGVLLSAVILIFLEPLMYVFGARDQVLDYAKTYTSITALGLTFQILGSGGSQLIRADGSPRYAMFSILAGAVLNTILDPLFIFGFHMGISGAALATITGQIVSGILVLCYFRKCRSVSLSRECFRPKPENLRLILSLGMAAGLNQLAVTVVQIVMNNSLGYYGEQSVYGRDIPLAVVGVVMKVNVIFSAATMGIAQSCQPIFGFNYGAGNKKRVKDTFLLAARIIFCISAAAFLCFQLFPRQIISIFGSGDELYYEFAVSYFRVFMMLVIVNGLQILCSNFFPSIGKGGLGVLTSLSRQVLFFLPLILILPLFLGINGILVSGPIADGAAILLSGSLAFREIRRWR